MRDYIYLGFYKFFSFLLFVIPRTMMIKVMYGLAWFAYTVSKKHQHIISVNLDLAFESSLSDKEKKKIGIEAFVNLIDTIFGIIVRDKMSKQEVIENVTFENEEIIRAYKDANKQFILVTGHYGNWELLSQSIAIKFDLTLVGVGRKLDSPMMDNILRANRERFNVEMLEKKGAIKSCIKVINAGKIVGILTDQSIGKGQSIDVDFFGNNTTHTPLASILSRKFDLDLIPAYISTDDYKQYKVKIYSPIKALHTKDKEEDLLQLTQAQAAITEEVICTKPKQWFWMHKRWKEYRLGLYKRS